MQEPAAAFASARGSAPAELAWRSARSRARPRCSGRADAGQEEIGAALDRDELRQALDAARRQAGPGDREDTGSGSSGSEARPARRGSLSSARPANGSLAVEVSAKSRARECPGRIALLAEAGELRALDPRVLHELELAGEVRDQADEMQPALLLILR